jgi:hypothetical protein
MGQNAACRRFLYGAALAVLLWGLSWFGLRFLVSHASGSLPEQLEADIVVPLARGSDRTSYANLLVSQNVARHLGSSLVDPRCVREHGPHAACGTGVRNTIDEAIVLYRLFKEERFTRSIIVTSPDHLARATAVFAVIFAGSGIEVHVVASSQAGSSSERITQEAKSYLPSIGAAVLARFLPAVYEWSLRELLGLEQDGNSPSPALLSP